MIDDLGNRNGTIFFNTTYNLNGFYNFPAGGYINLDNPFYINSSSNYTISLWARSSTDAGAPTMLSMRSTSSSTPILFQLDRSTTTNIRALIRNDTNTAVTLTASGVSSNNTWLHVVLTKIGNNHTLYINGTSFASANSFGNASVDRMIIGGGVAGSVTVQASSFWNGDLDEIRIYSNALNSSQVTQLFSQGMSYNLSLLNSSLNNYYSFSDKGFILANGTGYLNLTYLNNSIFDRVKINNTLDNRYDLGAPLLVNGANINFTIFGETLRLLSNPNYYSYLNVIAGNSLVNRSSIISWNNNSNSIDRSYINKTLTLRPRSWIKLTHGLCKIYDSNFSGLGYKEGLDSSSQLLEGIVYDTCDGGIIANSLFIENHFLFSAYNSDGINFFNNTGVNATGGNLSIAVSGFGFYSVINSRIYNNNVTDVKSPNGWKLDDSQSMTIKGIGYNNTAFGNWIYDGEAGLVIFNQHDNSSFVNNTIIGMQGSGIKVEDGNPTRTLRNILVYSNRVIDTGKNTGISTTPRYGIELDFSLGANNNSNFTVDSNIISDSYNCINTKYGQNISIINNNCINVSTTSFDTPLKGAFSIENSTRVSIRNNTIGNTSTLYQLALVDANVSSFKLVDSLQTINARGVTTNQFNYELIDALLFNSNGSLYGNSDLSQNDGNINITIPLNNITYVLDNFNLTEGVTRQFSPLSISGSSTSKTITSQLSQSINATVVVNVDQCSFKATYEGSNIQEDSCADGQATFTLIDIPASESFLELSYLDLNCSSNTGASIAIILIFSALAIVAITFIIVMKFKEGELDVKILIIVFIALIVGLVLFTQIAQLTGSVCN